MTTYWSAWEVTGDTAGLTRGAMRDGLRRSPHPPGWELADVHASVGSTGPWPHVVALWRATSAGAIEDWLAAGPADGIDESRLPDGRALLLRAERGDYPADAAVFRYERFVAADRASLLTIKGPDFVLSDLLCPWQGVALWGSADLAGLAAREQAGIGLTQHPGITACVGWWISPMPSRDIV